MFKNYKYNVHYGRRAFIGQRRELTIIVRLTVLGQPSACVHNTQNFQSDPDAPLTCQNIQLQHIDELHYLCVQARKSSLVLVSAQTWQDTK